VPEGVGTFANQWLKCEIFASSARRLVFSRPDSRSGSSAPARRLRPTPSGVRARLPAAGAAVAPEQAPWAASEEALPARAARARARAAVAQEQAKPDRRAAAPQGKRRVAPRAWTCRSTPRIAARAAQAVPPDKRVRLGSARARGDSLIAAAPVSTQRAARSIAELAIRRAQPGNSARAEVVNASRA
jgi:hypothetical protein